MRIANPLYDHAFKYLMSNDRLAKKVLSTILEKEIFYYETIQKLEAEQEFEDMFAQQENNIAYLSAEVKKAQEREEEERKQKEEERKQKEATLRSAIKMATKYGASPQQIVEDMNLPLQRVLEIIQEK